MKKFFEEFKAFAMRGNVIDLAVGVVIGGAFGKITSSLVADIIMPLVGLAVGGLDVSQWKIVLKEAVLNAEGAVDGHHNLLDHNYWYVDGTDVHRLLLN